MIGVILGIAGRRSGFREDRR